MWLKFAKKISSVLLCLALTLSTTIRAEKLDPQERPSIDLRLKSKDLPPIYVSPAADKYFPEYAIYKKELHQFYKQQAEDDVITMICCGIFLGIIACCIKPLIKCLVKFFSTEFSTSKISLKPKSKRRKKATIEL